MSLERDFLAMASTTVFIEPLSTHGVYGAPRFGTGVTYVARVEAESNLVIGTDGQEVLTKFRVFVMSSSANIGLSDRISAAGSTELKILRVLPQHDDEGQHHVELVLT